jgi:hypothetical protein
MFDGPLSTALRLRQRRWGCAERRFEVPRAANNCAIAIVIR